jgi:hypothetical protein
MARTMLGEEHVTNDMARTMLGEYKTPERFWSEAVNIA